MSRSDLIVIITCDDCGKETEVLSDGNVLHPYYNQVIDNRIKDLGWTITCNSKPILYHYCPDCKKMEGG